MIEKLIIIVKIGHNFVKKSIVLFRVLIVSDFYDLVQVNNLDTIVDFDSL